MDVKQGFLVILYLTVTVATIHEPQVHEELDEQPPVYKRRTRHLQKSESIPNFHQPPVFSYQPSQQQDRLKSRYDRQQQADFRNLKMKSDSFVRQAAPKSFNSNDDNNEWKPFQPSFLYPKASKPVINSQRKARYFSQSIKLNEPVRQNKNEIDLNAAGSETHEEVAKSDRQDQQPQYIYVSPSTLKDKFGFDAKTSEEIIQSSTPGNENTDSEQFKITDLQELLGKNPSFQLQGLQRLLEDGKPVVHNNLPISSGKDISDIHIQHNGSPSLDSLQQQIDAVNRAQEHEVLAAAQKQAEAHVQAQHRAIALAQKKAQEEAFAKIAAHNQGLATLDPEQLQNSQGNSHATAAVVSDDEPAQVAIPEIKPDQEIAQEIHENAVEQPAQRDSITSQEVSALQGRPLDQLIVNPIRHYGGSYASSIQDLRNVKPRIEGARGRFYRPVALANSFQEPAKLQYLSEAPPLYDAKEVQNYSPVSPYTPHLGAPSFYTKIVPQPTEPTLINLPSVQEQNWDTSQEIHASPSPANINQLYSEEQYHDDEHQQYAAKYAFGYRILEEKHGNDFGHEEERNGKLTKGHYYVRLPDGRKQRVDYYADKSGYHARVRYENVAKHHFASVENVEQAHQLQPIHQ